MKKIILVFLFTLSLFGNEFKEIAENFLTYKGIEKEIISTQELSKEDSIVGNIFYLSDGGYIVVPTSKIASPIKVFSLQAKEIADIYLDFLIDDLYKFYQMERNLERTIDSRISARWDFLENFETSSRVLNTYIPNTYLLKTTWNQHYPYNKFFPQVGDETTLVGCVQVAMGQLMKYHEYPSTGRKSNTFDAKLYDSNDVLDRTEKMTAVYYKNYNWEIMPEDFDGEYNESSADEVAYLLRDLVVLNEAVQIGVGETGASADLHQLHKKLGYSRNYKSASLTTNTLEEIVNIVKDQINQNLPVLLSIPGHMVVADGYQNDESGKFVHLNMGWGGDQDNYYNLDEDISSEFPQVTTNDLSIHYNIKPCSDDVVGDCFVNLEDNDTVSDYINDTLEIGDSETIYTDNTLEVADSLSTENRTIVGQLENREDKDQFLVYLSGETEINRKSQYFNIAIYQLDGTLIAESLTNNLSEELLAGKYLIKLSQRDSSGMGYSHWETMDYNLSIITESESIEVNQNEIPVLSGKLNSATDIDKFEVYLSGTTSISRKNKYFNIAIYDFDGNLIEEETTDNISTTLDEGKYTVQLSKTSSTGFYYNWDSDEMEYELLLLTEAVDRNFVDSNLPTVTAIKGDLYDIKDVDKFDFFLEGNISLIRTNPYYNLSIHKQGIIETTLIAESQTENLNVELEAGKYRIILSKNSSDGTFYYWDSKEYEIQLVGNHLDSDDVSIVKNEIDSLPTIEMELKDRVISKPTDILLNVYDLNGDRFDTIVETNEDILSTSLNKNILTLSPNEKNQIVDVTIRLDGKGSDEKSFTILTLDEELAFGDDAKIESNFENGEDIYSHKILLDGECTIDSSGYTKGYLAVFDDKGNSVLNWEDNQRSNYFDYGIYTIKISLNNPANGYYYFFDQNRSKYSISVNCENFNSDISSLATLLNIEDNRNTIVENNDSSEELVTSSEINLSLVAGWNLIANPKDSNFEMDELSDKIEYVFKYENESWLVWENGNYDSTGYQIFTQFTPEFGYWFRMVQPATISLEGTPAYCPDISSLESGWHLLGSCEKSVAEMIDENSNSMIFYKYWNESWKIAGNENFGVVSEVLENNGFEIFSEVKPYEGFWIYID
jgi:hypothetical protein